MSHYAQPCAVCRIRDRRPGTPYCGWLCRWFGWLIQRDRKDNHDA